MNLKPCHICNTPIPEEFTQDHHMRPQATGGKDGETVPLCAGCHANLHRISEMILKGRASKALDMAKTLYAPQQLARMMTLAKTVAEWFQTKNDGFTDDTDEVPVMFTLPVREKVALQTLASETRVDGKKGVNRYVRQLVLNHLYQKFPLLKPRSTP